jgi:Fic family protein
LTRLEDLTRGAQAKGIRPDGPVEVLDAKWHGTNAPDLHEQRVFLEARLPALRHYFGQRPALKNADYRGLFSVTRETARHELGQLVELGFLDRRGERRGTHYLPGAVFPARQL